MLKYDFLQEEENPSLSTFLGCQRIIIKLVLKVGEVGYACNLWQVNAGGPQVRGQGKQLWAVLVSFWSSQG